MIAAAQTDYYLSPTGLDTNDCTSSGSACATVAHVETLAQAGDTIHFASGLYRLTVLTDPTTAPTAGRIVAKDNQTFTGDTCTPTTAACGAVLDGSVLLGTFTPPTGNDVDYTIAGPATTHGAHGCYPCAEGWGGCNYPEELYVDGSELQHAGQHLGGTIAVASVAGGTITGTGACTATGMNAEGPIANATVAITAGVPTGNLTVSGFTDCDGAIPTSWVLSGGTGGASCTGSATVTTTGGSVSPPTLTSTSWWYDYTNNVIHLGQNPTGHVVATAVTVTAVAPVTTQANNVTVEDLTVQKFAAQNQQGGGIDPSYGQTSGSQSGSGWVVQDNYVTLNHSDGIRASFGMQIANNVVTMNGQLGLGGGMPAAQGASGLVVAGNHVTYNNISHMSPGFGAGGIKFGNTRGAVVRGNVVDHNYGNGIHFDVNSIAPVIDGNSVTQNWDAISATTMGAGTGIIFEIGNGGAVIRNNYVQFNGTGGTYGIQSSTSEGAVAYCNVVEEMTGISNDLWMINAADRGPVAATPYPDYCPADTACAQASEGNYFHNNTYLWDPGATGAVGFAQHDTANQPMFFTVNTPPNFDEYHLSPALGAGALKFLYDDNNSGSNTLRAFGAFQTAGADKGGRVDTIDAMGHPAVAIASPMDGASVSGSGAVTVNASDHSGITEVNLYVDWTMVAKSTAAPYTFDLTGTANGSHVVAAVAKAQSTVTASNAVTINYTAGASSGTDAGAGGGGGGGLGDDAGAGGAKGKPAGCGCRTAGAADGVAPVLVLVAGLVGRRRRRRAVAI